MYHSSVGCVVSPALDARGAQLQRLQESRKIRTLQTAVRAILTHSHELWSKVVNLNLDLNSVSETDITLTILKKKTNKQTNKITYDSHSNKIQAIAI